MNKSNTKAELRLNLATENWLLDEVRRVLAQRHRSNVLIIKCDMHRTQPDNQRACREMLMAQIVQAAKAAAPAPPTPAKEARVHEIVVVARERRLRLKRLDSQKKRDRRACGSTQSAEPI